MNQVCELQGVLPYTIVSVRSLLCIDGWATLCQGRCFQKTSPGKVVIKEWLFAVEMASLFGAPSDRFELRPIRFELKSVRFELKLARFEGKIHRFELKTDRFELEIARFELKLARLKPLISGCKVYHGTKRS